MNEITFHARRYSFVLSLEWRWDIRWRHGFGYVRYGVGPITLTIYPTHKDNFWRFPV